MPATTKANYKTYESQARMVRAIVAAHPDVKWNYKEISRCYGTDMTEHALNHRFRIIRAHTEIVHLGLRSGLDMKYLPAEPPGNPRTVESVDKTNIAKYFGASTADGMQFQFRSIKKDADAMRRTADGGGDPASVSLTIAGGGTMSSSSTPGVTPRSATKAAARTPRSGRGGLKQPRSAVAARRRSLKDSASDDEDGDDVDDEDVDADEDDEDLTEVDTPTKSTGRARATVLSGRVTKARGGGGSGRTPSSRAAAAQAAAQIYDQAAAAAGGAGSGSSESGDAVVETAPPRMTRPAAPAAAPDVDIKPSLASLSRDMHGGGNGGGVRAPPAAAVIDPRQIQFPAHPHHHQQQQQQQLNHAYSQMISGHGSFNPVNTFALPGIGAPLNVANAGSAFGSMPGDPDNSVFYDPKGEFDDYYIDGEI